MTTTQLTREVITQNPIEGDILTRKKPVTIVQEVVKTQPTQVISQPIQPISQPVIRDITNTVTKANTIIEKPIQNIQYSEMKSSRLNTLENEDPALASSRAGRQAQAVQGSAYGGYNRAAIAGSLREKHQVFEDWDNKNKLFINERLNPMEDMLAGMERKTGYIENGVLKSIEWFKERESMIDDYLKNPKLGLPQLGTFLDTLEMPVRLGEFSTAMREVDGFYNLERQKKETMLTFMKQNIQEIILMKAENQFKEGAKTLRLLQTQSRKKLDFVINKVTLTYGKYYKNYAHLQKSMKLDAHENDLQRRQLKYSLRAREALRMLKAYNEQALIMINEFAKLCKNLMTELQRAFVQYFLKYIELQPPSESTMRPAMQMIEAFNVDEAIDQMFTPQRLLTYTNYELLQKRLRKENLTFEDLSEFLVNFQDPTDPARSLFIVGEWNASKKGFLSKEKPCLVLASVEGGLFIVEKKQAESEMGLVKNPLQLRYITVERSYNRSESMQSIVTVIEKAPGGMFHHNPKVKLQFRTAQEAQSFLEFVGMRSQYENSGTINNVVPVNSGLGIANLATNNAHIPIQNVSTPRVVSHIPSNSMEGVSNVNTARVVSHIPSRSIDRQIVSEAPVRTEVNTNAVLAPTTSIFTVGRQGEEQILTKIPSNDYIRAETTTPKMKGDILTRNKDRRGVTEQVITETPVSNNVIRERVVEVRDDIRDRRVPLVERTVGNYSQRGGLEDNRVEVLRHNMTDFA